MFAALVLIAPFAVLVGYFYVQSARSSHAQRALTHVLLFLAAGPLLLPAVVLLVGLTSELLQLRPPGIWEIFSIPIGVVSGALVWWGHGLTGGWMATIAPTAFAGMLTWAALEAIDGRRPNATGSKERRRWERIAVSSVASAAAFSFFYVVVPKEQASPALDSLWPALGYVVVVGAAVGAMIESRIANVA